MKKLALILLLFGCVEQKKEVPILPIPLLVSDTTPIVYESLMDKIGQLKAKVNLLGIERAVLYLQIDSLQNDVINNQGNSMKLAIINKRVDLFISKNHYLIDKIDELNAKNKELKDCTISKQSQLVAEKTISRQLRKVINDKKEESITIVGLNAKAFGKTKKTLFKKASLIETKTAKLVEYVDVLFYIPANERVKKQTYSTTATINGAKGARGISKSLLIDFEGKEISCKITFDDPTEWQVGGHKIDIIIDGKILNSMILNLE